jgi:hypothetical protein
MRLQVVDDENSRWESKSSLTAIEGNGLILARSFTSDASGGRMSLTGCSAASVGRTGLGVPRDLLRRHWRGLAGFTRFRKQLKAIPLEKFLLNREKVASQLALLPNQLTEVLVRAVAFGGLVKVIGVRNLSAHFCDMDTQVRLTLPFC